MSINNNTGIHGNVSLVKDIQQPTIIQVYNKLRPRDSYAMYKHLLHDHGNVSLVKDILQQTIIQVYNKLRPHDSYAMYKHLLHDNVSLVKDIQVNGVF